MAASQSDPQSDNIRQDEASRLAAELADLQQRFEQLRESEQLYRCAVELSPHFAWSADPEGRLRLVSERLAEIIGPGEHRTAQENWAAAVHPDDREPLFSTWAAVRASGEPGHAEFRMRVADGSYRDFRAHAAPLKGEDGAIVGWFGFAEDIHESKRTQEALRAAEERYALAARATNDAVWDLDLIKNEIHWSDSSSEALGYPGRRLGTTGLDWWEERVHPDDRAAVVSSLQEAIHRGRSRWSANYRFRRGNGDYASIFDRGFLVRNASGEPVRAVGAMADLTDRQKAEQEVRRMQAELIHVSRLSAMGTMASTLAHELNQPLTAVTNYLRGTRRLLDREEGAVSDEVREALAAAEAGALRAGKIVRRLRELVARGNSALRPEELPRLIEDAAVLGFVDEHVQGVTHRIEIDPEAHWVEVDRVQIQQVLINLIRNAMQAMQERPQREVVVAARPAAGDMVEVSVADSGPGIPSEAREGLFSPFQGSKPQGLGIGLSISRTIVEAHGGKIWAEDRDGGGAIFRFTVPGCDPTKAG